jgi:hypothetical protein
LRASKSHSEVSGKYAGWTWLWTVGFRPIEGAAPNGWLGERGRRSLNREDFYLQACAAVAEARTEIGKRFKFYNDERLYRLNNKLKRYSHKQESLI